MTSKRRAHQRTGPVRTDDLSVVLAAKVPVDVGVHARSKFNPDAAHHVVVRGEAGGWVALCSGSPAVRSYKGWLHAAVTCPHCVKAHHRSHDGNSEGTT